MHHSQIKNSRPKILDDEKLSKFLLDKLVTSVTAFIVNVPADFVDIILEVILFERATGPIWQPETLDFLLYLKLL